MGRFGGHILRWAAPQGIGMRPGASSSDAGAEGSTVVVPGAVGDPTDRVLSPQMLPVAGTPTRGSVTTAAAFPAAGGATALPTARMAPTSRTAVGGPQRAERGQEGLLGGAGRGVSVAPSPQCVGRRSCSVPALTTASRTGSCATGTRTARTAGTRRAVPCSPACPGSGSAGTGCASRPSGSATGSTTAAIPRTKMSVVSGHARCSLVG